MMANYVSVLNSNEIWQHSNLMCSNIGQLLNPSPDEIQCNLC
jgi:hypothetical protein